MSHPPRGPSAGHRDETTSGEFGSAGFQRGGHLTRYRFALGLDAIDQEEGTLRTAKELQNRAALLWWASKRAAGGGRVSVTWS